MRCVVNENNIEEYIGQRFGNLTVVDWIPRDNKKERLKVKCVCDCGKECVKVFKEIRSGNTHSCGCRFMKIKTEEDYKEFIGKKYGRLTITKYVGRAKDGHAQVECLCDCGNVRINAIKDVTNGYVKSCGCLQKEIVRTNFLIDNRTNERLYNIYLNMKARCYNINNPNYKHYGERGICICDEWLSDYLLFKNWAISNGYNENLTIDRIDVNGNYEPSNCRWATLETQAQKIIQIM